MATKTTKREIRPEPRMDELQKDILKDRRERHANVETLRPRIIREAGAREQRNLRQMAPTPTLTPKQAKSQLQAQLRDVEANGKVEKLPDQADVEAQKALDQRLYDRIATSAKQLSRLMTVSADDLAKVIGFWARHVPFQEREDVMQSLCLTLIYDHPANAKLAFVRCRWFVLDWWKHENMRAHGELDAPLTSAHGEGAPITLADTLVGACQYERYEDIEHAKSVLKRIPKHIRRIVQLKLDAPKRLTNWERSQLRTWGEKHAHLLWVE